MGSSVAVESSGKLLAVLAVAIAAQTSAVEDVVVEANPGSSSSIEDLGHTVAMIGYAPTMVSAFLGDIFASLFQPEVRRGFFIMGLLLATSMWLLVRLARAVLYRLLKRVSEDVFQDQQVAKLGCQRFIKSMIDLQDDPNFKDTYVKVLWSPESASNFRDSLNRALEDEHLVKGIANLIRSLTGLDFLMDNLKNSLRETLADEDIHRAMIAGSLDALKPDWMRQESPNSLTPEDKSVSTPPAKVRTNTDDGRSSLPGILGGGSRTNFWS